MRRAIPLVLATLAAVALPLAPVAARADAPVRAVQVSLADPLMTDPVQLLVSATDADGDAAAFSGIVTLTTGRTTVTAAVSGDGTAPAEVDVPTDALSGGPATARAVVRGGGGTATASVARIVDVPVSFAIAGFGCAALTAAGGDLRFAVTVLDGQPVPHPVVSGTWQLPYLTVSNGPTRMVDADGAGLPTTGRLTLRAGARTIAVLALPRAVRQTVFAVHWRGGRAPLGAATATLALTDAHGRTATAVRSVAVVRSGTMPCA